MEGVTLDYRAGGYTDGGGAQQRFQIGGGDSWGALDAMFALELNNQNPDLRLSALVHQQRSRQPDPARWSAGRASAIAC